MMDVVSGEQKRRVKRQKGQKQGPTQGKERLGMKGQQKLKKEKSCFLTHKKPSSVATQGYAGEDPSEIPVQGVSMRYQCESDPRSGTMQISACSL
jgi:hypothetical protein